MKSARSGIRRPWTSRSNSKGLAGNFVTDLNQLLQLLRVAEIDFVIVGGFAAVLHGSSLVTRDLDVCTVLSAAALPRHFAR